MANQDKPTGAEGMERLRAAFESVAGHPGLVPTILQCRPCGCHVAMSPACDLHEAAEQMREALRETAEFFGFVRKLVQEDAPDLHPEFIHTNNVVLSALDAADGKR